MVGEERALLPEILGQTNPNGTKLQILNRYSSAVTPSEKKV